MCVYKYLSLINQKNFAKASIIEYGKLLSPCLTKMNFTATASSNSFSYAKILQKPYGQ